MKNREKTKNGAATPGKAWPYLDRVHASAQISPFGAEKNHATSCLQEIPDPVSAKKTKVGALLSGRVVLLATIWYLVGRIELDQHHE